MPIYEYLCDDCDHRLEVMQKISEEKLKECPECGEESLRKLVSAASFRLKGTGWYETDFKDKPKKSTEKPKNGEKSETISKSISNNSSKSTDSTPSASKKASSDSE